MGTYLYDHFIFIRFLLIFLPLFLLQLTVSLSSMQPVCHEDESSALLQFKDTFIINKSASSDDPFAYPKVASWILEGGNYSTDCCSWDGVECDEDTGRVVGLDVSSSCLYGSINSSNSLFRLVQLRRLNLAYNHFNYSQIPFEFGNLSRLTYLNLSASFFSGQIPSEVSHLSELSYLDLSLNDHLHAKSLQVLVQNLTNLEELWLSSVNLTSTVPDILANFSTLTTLRLRNCGLYGDFPTKIFQLPNLRDLRIGFNQDLTGYLPEFNSSNSLGVLGLKATSFFGILPTSIGNLTFLNILDISDCNFSGSIPPSLSNLTQLHYLVLSHNHLQGQIPASLPVNLNQVTALGLANNYLQGTIPSSFSKLKNLEYLDLSGNYLTGEISRWICNMSSLKVLDFSYNNLRGVLHPCFSNCSQFLSVLELRSNNFHGTIPKSWAKESSLRMIDLSQNQLKGQLPRSLAKCTMLEFLHVGGNQINDTFPFWLGTLPELKVLNLHSNGFNGIIRCPGTNYTFPKLRIIDLSLNDFSGNLPTSCFLHWDAMKTTEANQLIYLNASVAGDGWRSGDLKSIGFWYSVTVANKGLKLDYKKIQDVFNVIDFSSNRFEGEIPELLGSLKGLHLLNLSNNTLTGLIPSSLGNLTRMESMDLSQNKLLGEIPPQLTQLFFLEFFNVSNNYLKGPIPRGNQFNTFQDSSFGGNLGLCGSPLSKRCGDFNDTSTPPSLFKENQSSESLFEFSWKVIVIGYGCGLVIGVVIGKIVITNKYEWYMKTLEICSKLLGEQRLGESHKFKFS